MRWRAWAALFLAVGLLALAGSRSASAASLVLEVTSTEDRTGGDTACPSTTKCTLRRAIEVANAAPGGDTVTIRFSASAFPPELPATITLAGTPLPVLTSPGIHLDGSGAGVVISGASLPGTPSGLRVSGTDAAIRNIALSGFAGTCLSIEGPGASIGAQGAGNHIGGCAVGLRIGGASAVVHANVFGLDRGQPAPVTTAVVVAAGGTIVGGTASDTNHFVHVGVGILVEGAGSPPAAVSGVRIERNNFGEAPAATGIVGTGVRVGVGATEARIIGNRFIDIGLNAVEVVGDPGEPGPVRITIQANTFGSVGKLAVDLAADGALNPNDVGDADDGPNGLLNHPVLSRATQSQVTGTACPGCRVELYLASHTAGAPFDNGTVPVQAQPVVASASGAFSFDAPPVAPGQWLTALATDADGNTSEFGTPARVGSGLIQCTNPLLQKGWNVAGYFGAEPIALGSAIAGDPQRRIRAIYRLTPGGLTFTHWLRDSVAARTLTALQPGEVYWFLVDEPVTLPGGFLLTTAQSRQLKSGWNAIVYFGASEDARDALGAAAPSVDGLYRYANAPGQRWLSWGSLQAAGYARAFTRLEACSAYVIKASADVTLVPLQP